MFSNHSNHIIIWIFHTQSIVMNDITNIIVNTIVNIIANSIISIVVNIIANITLLVHYQFTLS
jgi:hypothetical protein